MKRLTSWGWVLATGLLSGCLQVEDELTIQPDGSGTVRVTTRTTVPEEMAGMLSAYSGGGRTGGGMIYPPVSEAEAQRFFPRKDFTLSVKETGTDEGQTVAIEAAFKDINALLASPYGRAHQLSLKIESGGLTIKAQTGGEAAARAAELKPEGELGAVELPGLEEAQKKKQQMKFRFRIALPNEATGANGAREGKVVTWEVERAKCRDGEEFAAKLAIPGEARCATNGLKFVPVTPPRLGLLPFSNLVAGAGAAPAALPDTNRVLAAARFVPYALRVTRGLDLSGEGNPFQSQAQLLGAVILPAELAPPQWGKASLLEAVDAQGKDLKPKEDEDALSRVMDHYGSMGEEEEPADAEAETAGKADEQRRMVSLSFRPPDWKVKQLARIRGSLALHYLGAPEVVKVSNAVPAGAIMDMSKPSGFAGFPSDDERGLITEARLTELGLDLRLQTAVIQSGMVMLSLEASGDRASLVDAQVFDAEGHPWPTNLQSDQSGGEERSCQIVVVGAPKAPLSLALLVSRVGSTVEVPILVEKVPLGAQ